jgi:hypothetical protein
MKTFFEFLSNRALAGGSTLPVTPYMFFQPFFNSDSISAAASPVLPIPFLQNPDVNQQFPSDRIMEALGSTWNNGNFVLLRDTLNGMKSRVSIISCILWRTLLTILVMGRQRAS